MAVLRRVVFLAGYVQAGLSLLVCLAIAAVLGILRVPAERRERWMAAVIHAACSLFVRGLRAGGALSLDLAGIDALRRHPGAIIIANHPTFLDAVFVFSFVPRSFCVVKPTVMRNPLLARTARVAGFLTAERPLSLVAEAGRRLATGRSMVVFPEGTRSVGDRLHPFQAGFALAAARSRAPVITLHVAAENPRFLRKGHPVLDLTPPLPVRYRFHVGEIFTVAPGETASQFHARVETAFRRRHGQPEPALAVPTP